MATPALPSAVGPVAATAALLPIGGAGDQSAAGRTSLDMATGSGTEDSAFRTPSFADALKFHLSGARSGEAGAAATDGKSLADRSEDQPLATPDAGNLAFSPTNLNVALALLQSSATTAPPSAESATLTPTDTSRNAGLPQPLAAANQGPSLAPQAATAEILAAPGKTPRYQEVANTVQEQAKGASATQSENAWAPALPAQALPAQALPAQALPAQANTAQANTAQANTAQANTAQVNTAQPLPAQANTVVPLPAAQPKADTAATSTALPPPVAGPSRPLAAAAPRESAPATATTAPEAGVWTRDQGHRPMATTATASSAVAPPLAPPAPATTAAVIPAMTSVMTQAALPASPATISDAAQSLQRAAALPAPSAGEKASPAHRPAAPTSDFPAATLASPLSEAPLTTLAAPVTSRLPVDAFQANPYFSPPLDTAATTTDAGRAEFAALFGAQAPAMTLRQDAPSPSATVNTPFGAPGWSEEVGKNVVWLAGQDQQKAELVLTPPNLGRIEISVTISNDQASASFVSANPAVREALEQALPRLREMFANAGISLGQTSIGAESSASGDNERNGSRFAGRRGRNLDVASILGSSSPAPGRQGVGMVDTFA